MMIPVPKVQRRSSGGGGGRTSGLTAGDEALHRGLSILEGEEVGVVKDKDKPARGISKAVLFGRGGGTHMRSTRFGIENCCPRRSCDAQIISSHEHRSKTPTNPNSSARSDGPAIQISSLPAYESRAAKRTSCS